MTDTTATPATTAATSGRVATSGSMVKLKRSSAYVPIFRRTPASITDTGVGACTWASGSHVWTGTTGTFTAKPANMAANATSFRVAGSSPTKLPSSPFCSAIVISGSPKEPTGRLNTSAMNPMNMTRLAMFVYTKNLIAAYFRRGPPHTPMRKYIGTSTASQKTNHRKKSSAVNTPSRFASMNSMRP